MSARISKLEYQIMSDRGRAAEARVAELERAKRILRTAARGGNATNDNAELMETVAILLEENDLGTTEMRQALRYRALLIRDALREIGPIRAP